SEKYSFQSPDFQSMFRNAAASNPDVLHYMGTIAGLKVFHDLGLHQAGIKPVVVGGMHDIGEPLENIGEAGLAVISASNYTYSGRRPQNIKFVEGWYRELGRRSIAPNCFAVGGWDAMAAIFQVIKATGGRFTTDEAMKVLSVWENPNSPRGPIMIDPQT